jgi:hypothetical protein
VSLSIEIDRENYFAVDPDFAGAEAFIAFRLSNGQVDEHPRSSTVPVGDALVSIEDFPPARARSASVSSKRSANVAHVDPTPDSALHRTWSRALLPPKCGTISCGSKPVSLER